MPIRHKAAGFALLATVKFRVTEREDDAARCDVLGAGLGMRDHAPTCFWGWRNGGTSNHHRCGPRRTARGAVASRSRRRGERIAVPHRPLSAFSPSLWKIVHID